MMYFTRRLGLMPPAPGTGKSRIRIDAPCLKTHHVVNHAWIIEVGLHEYGTGKIIRPGWNVADDDMGYVVNSMIYGEVDVENARWWKRREIEMERWVHGYHGFYSKTDAIEYAKKLTIARVVPVCIQDIAMTGSVSGLDVAVFHRFFMIHDKWSLL